jgi:hypothetical protein
MLGMQLYQAMRGVSVCLSRSVYWRTICPFSGILSSSSLQSGTRSGSSSSLRGHDQLMSYHIEGVPAAHWSRSSMSALDWFAKTSVRKADSAVREMTTTSPQLMSTPALDHCAKSE